MANEEDIITTTTDSDVDVDEDEDEVNQWQQQEYDVYVSFRGIDTRMNFTSNLQNALRLNRFKIFIDDGFKKGEQISPLIFFKALQVSRIAIVVFSENFVSSTFCLDELAKILEYRRTKKQHILPVFYGVNPSEVRRISGRFARDFYAHEQRYRYRELGSEKVLKWKSALSEFANLCGEYFQLDGNQYEYELIENIVRRVANILPRYNIFLNFCEGTRYSFTDYLYNALNQEGFKTFMKDRKCKDMYRSSSQDPVTTIAKSRLSIIVFCKNYAYSSLCLDELVTILGFMKNKNQLVWPIFYKVEPSYIRHQKKSYGKAMIKHENILGKDSEKVKTWRSALFEVSNLKGWHLKYGYEYDLIEKIVETAIKI